MEIKDIVAKLGDEKAKELLGEDGVKAAISMLSTSSDYEKKLKDSDGKAGRILAEKKELQDKLAAFESEVENLKKSGMSEADKMKSEYEKTIKRAEKAEKEHAALMAEYSKSKRTIAIDKIASTVKFIDAVTPEAGRILLESGLASVQSLDDADALTAALTTFKESYKTLIAADNQASGGGTRQPAGKAGTSGGKLPSQMTIEERHAELKKRGMVS